MQKVSLPCKLAVFILPQRHCARLDILTDISDRNVFAKDVSPHHQHSFLNTVDFYTNVRLNKQKH